MLSNCKGIFRKVLIFALVGVGHLLDVQVLGSIGVLRTAVIFFYLSNEGVSLMVKKPDTPVYVQADPRHLWRVLDNLMTNKSGV